MKKRSTSEILEVARATINYKDISPGYTVPSTLLEEITGLNRDLSAYSLAITEIRIDIERWHLGRLQGVTDKGDIRFLTESERVDFHSRTFKNRRKGMIRQQFKALDVDVRELTDEENAAHYRNLIRQGYEIMGLSLVNKKLKVPLLPARDPRQITDNNTGARK